MDVCVQISNACLPDVRDQIVKRTFRLFDSSRFSTIAADEFYPNFVGRELNVSYMILSVTSNYKFYNFAHKCSRVGSY